MPPPPAPSNIRAFVHWRESSVFAGEEIECNITFKNVALLPGKEKDVQTQANGSASERLSSYAPSATQSRRSSIIQNKIPSTRAPSVSGQRGAPQSRGHRPTLSLNVGSGQSISGAQSASVPLKTQKSAVAGHGKSLSIMSLGSNVHVDERTPGSALSTKRPAKGHGRSASLQLVSKQPAQASLQATGPSPRQPSPLYESTTPPTLEEGQKETLPIRPTRRRAGIQTADNTPELRQHNSSHRDAPAGSLNASFQFPPQNSKPKSPSPQREQQMKRSPSTMHSGQQRSFSPRPPDGFSGTISNLNPIARVMSESSATGTPRSSSEFYSISNHSDETLTSELPSQYRQNGKLLSRLPHSRAASTIGPGSSQLPAGPETLMMGFVQTRGYFVLDGSLVNAAPFEEIKRKGVQSGGGVVGVERSKRSSGMFGAFSWGAIGESIGGLLGAEDMSSMAQMKATAGSRSIPLLSTPQNLLFVDLRLAPGESKSYNYRFALPRGLPPTHKGRAIKVAYHLALGVQRPGDQAVRPTEVPFRVLGSYNSRGEALGHDLLSPYILLQDTARSTSVAVSPSSTSDVLTFAPKETSNIQAHPKQALEDFLRYTERLLDHPKGAQGALMSPTSPSSPGPTRKESTAEARPIGVREAIDFAILRANFVTGPGTQTPSEAQSANRFNITRAGQPVAVLTLLRAAFRVGEAVIGIVDFTAQPNPASSLPSQVSTFSVLAELESAERVDASLALRSSSSINRVTRKVHSAMRDSTLFARQVSFHLGIPATATPTFETTGVSLVWTLRVEFTTQRQAHGLGLEGRGPPGDDHLLEEIGNDERGKTLIAKERLVADSFEIAVPLKVYGAPDVDAVGSESEALEI